MPLKLKQRKSPGNRKKAATKDSPLVINYVVREHYDTAISATQTVVAGSFASVVTFGTMQFRLSNITNNTKFTQLYDQFMIRKVDLHFLPIVRGNVMQWTNTPPGTNLTDSLFVGPSYFHLVPDFDDFVSPTTITEVVHRPNSVTLDLKDPAKYSIVPKSTVKTADVVSNLMTVVPKACQWIDCSNSNVDHLGLKYAWQIPVSNASTADYPYEASLCIIATYHLSFRYPRL